VAVASIPDSSGVYHGCFKKSDGNIRIIDSNATSCSSNEIEMTWSQQGPPGQPGAPGTAGQTGPRGPSDAYVKDQKGSFGAVTISTTAPTTILTLSALPPGNYVVNSSAAISGPSGFAVTSCKLTNGTGSSLSAAFQASTGGGTGFTFAVIPVSTSFTLAATTDVNVSCLTSAANVISQPSVMTAIKVDALH